MRKTEFISTPSPITQGSLTEQEALCQSNNGTPQTLPVAKINRKKRAKRSSKVRPVGVRVTKKKSSNVMSALLNKMGQLGKLPCTNHSITHISKATDHQAGYLDSVIWLARKEHRGAIYDFH